MTIQFIEIGADRIVRRPVVKLTEASPGSVWKYMGSCMAAPQENREVRRHHDLNFAAEAAAAVLAKKVSARDITVELLIDPLIPPMFIEMDKVVPILTLIAENASASVEPGPGTVQLITWSTDKHVGMDAVGRGGHVPPAVLDSWTLPGFSTRVADWDTGFGLHDAIRAADAIAARIELLDQTESVALRLAIPLHMETPLPSAEAEVGAPPELGLSLGCVLQNGDVPAYSMLSSWGGTEDARHEGIVHA